MRGKLLCKSCGHILPNGVDYSMEALGPVQLGWGGAGRERMLGAAVAVKSRHKGACVVWRVGWRSYVWE